MEFIESILKKERVKDDSESLSESFLVSAISLSFWTTSIGKD